MSRASSGAAWLDGVLPSWYKKTKRPINIASYTDCVGGQIDGEFGLFAQKRGLSTAEAVKLGFHFKKLDPTPREIQALNADWQREVEKRKTAKQVEVVAG